MATNDRRTAMIPGGFGAGVLASIAMMVVMAILRFTTNTISIPELMEESVIHLAGGQVEAFFINTLGVGGKALLLVSIMEGTLLVGGLLGLAFTHYLPVHRFSGDWRTVSGILYGLIIGTLLNVIFLPLAGQGFFGAYATQVTAPSGVAMLLYGSTLAPFGIPAWLNMYILGLIFALVLVSRLPQPYPVAAAESPQAGVMMSRRSVLNAIGGVVLALIGGVVSWVAIRGMLAPPPVAELQTAGASQPNRSPAPAETPLPEVQVTPVTPAFEGVQPKMVPEITPVESFYITTKNFIDPTVDAGPRKLYFAGMVENAYSLTLNDIKAMPAEERIETLACISNPVGGNLIGNARWKGVNFADLLERAKPKSGAVDLLFRCVDGYTDSIPLHVAQANQCFLAYEMNGSPLVARHGYPVRLLVPGIYGMKNVKWLTQVELVNYDYKGYWESQGWSETAEYQTMSRIDYPLQGSIPAKPIYVSGIAFAGNRGIKKVEVSTDGGSTWNEAQLRPPLGKYTWVLWLYPWQPKPGSYKLVVRATDGTGELQTAQEADTYPNGATGYHWVPLNAV